jgi:hypothetical protein
MHILQIDSWPGQLKQPSWHLGGKVVWQTAVVMVRQNVFRCCQCHALIRCASKHAQTLLLPAARRLPLSALSAGLQQLTILVSSNLTTVGLACLTSLTRLKELSVHGCGLTFPNEQGEDVPCIDLHVRERRLFEVRWRFEAIKDSDQRSSCRSTAVVMDAPLACMTL